MIADLRMPVELRMGPTYREPDGLAMSSRNRYLDAREREQAPALHRALARVREQVQAGQRDFARLTAAARAELERAGFKPDYVEMRRQGDLAAASPTARASSGSCSAPLGSAARGSSTTYSSEGDADRDPVAARFLRVVHRSIGALHESRDVVVVGAVCDPDRDRDRRGQACGRERRRFAAEFALPSGALA